MKIRFFIFILIIILGGRTTIAQDTVLPPNYKIFHYPNGVISSEGILVDGKPDGYWKSYSEEGVLISEGNRKNFELDGVWKFYAPTGELRMELEYKNGKKDGNRIVYSPQDYSIEKFKQDTLVDKIAVYYNSGKIKSEVPVEMGKKHGLEKEYDTTGLVVMVTHYFGGVMTRRESINRTDNFGMKQGNWKFFWENGNLKEEGTFYNDKKHGFFKYYDEEGNFLAVEKWDRGVHLEDAKETKKLEPKVAYHPNGKPAITTTFYKGIEDGIRREYDTTGKVIRGYLFINGWMRFEGVTDLNGLRQGLWKEYYPTGELRSQGHYKNSKMVGKWKFYYPTQELEMEGAYLNGVKDGEWVRYYPNQEPLMIENWAAGEREGLFIEYDEYGKVMTQGEYKEDSEEGPWFYSNRGVIEKGEYYDGMRIGVWKIWFANGNLAYEVEYDQDLCSGNYTAYWENGFPRISGKYVGGEQDGIWTKYDEDGTPYLTIIYKNGKEVQWNQYKIK